MAKQLKNGKAFEYALLKALDEKLLLHNVQVVILETPTYGVAMECYGESSELERQGFDLAASSAINFIIDIEPRLAHAIDNNDILELEIIPDTKGEQGDVRDVLAIRKSQEWEIGISAKNNHRAVKHQRLSMSIDFGEKWMGIPCSTEYFDEIAPIFGMLEKLKCQSPLMKWSDLKDKSDKVYEPILNAFIKELNRMNSQNPALVASGLVAYLIGRKDFYKVIKLKNRVQVQGFNINGTLSQPFGKIQPKGKVKHIKLPSRIVEIAFKPKSKTTILITFDEGWQLSLRIHSAATLIENSLKFDVNMVSNPYSIFSNVIFL